MRRCLRPTTVLPLALLMANAAAWVWAWSAFAGRPVLMGTALLAWVFGLRHAVDADHITAIDNVVRRQLQDGLRPFAVGLWFSLGHASVVVLASLVLAVAGSAVQTRLPLVRDLGGLIGTSISAMFLLAVAVANLLILRETWRRFLRARRGGAAPNAEVPQGGLLARVFGPVLRAVTRPRQMYLVGFLFGLGFDTATEIGLLGISAAQAAQGLSLWQILIFPVLFTTGMSLVDTADSMLMEGAYAWAFVDPARKLWYNLTITAASVIVAVMIGGIEALGMAVDHLGLEGRAWRVITRMNQDMTGMGVTVIAVFVLCWAASAAVYRLTGQARVALRG